MKIVICGYYGMGNVGDEAILQGLSGYLKKNIPEVQIEVMGKGNLFPVGLRSALKSLFDWDLWRKPAGLVRGADAFILGGGGLFTDEETHWVPAFWALQGLIAAIFLKKRVYCVGISVGEIKVVNKWLTKKLFQKSRLLIVRDPRSQEILKLWGIDSVLGSDFALLIQPHEIPKANGKKYVVIALRSFKNFNETLCKKFAQICDSIIKESALSIIFLPFHNDSENDLYIMNKIFDLCENKNNIKIDTEAKTLQDVLSIISGAEFIVAMRLHAGILSLLVGTPFLPISYMGKVQNFWSEFPDVHVSEFSEEGLDALAVNVSEYIFDWRQQKAGLTDIKLKLFERLLVADSQLISKLQKS